MRIPCTLGFFLLLGLCLHAQSDRAAVRVGCLAGGDTVLGIGQLQHFAPRTVMVTDHQGRSAEYTGALLMDILLAGCPALEDMGKKQRTALAVRVDAWDGYVVAVALTEADTAFRAHPVLLAWARDGAPLSERDGPLQLVVPDDIKHARNVRGVKALHVMAP